MVLGGSYWENPSDQGTAGSGERSKQHGKVRVLINYPNDTVSVPPLKPSYDPSHGVHCPVSWSENTPERHGCWIPLPHILVQNKTRTINRSSVPMQSANSYNLKKTNTNDLITLLSINNPKSGLKRRISFKPKQSQCNHHSAHHFVNTTCRQLKPIQTRHKKTTQRGTC